MADRDETALAHLAATAPRLHEPLGGVLGTHVPVVADSEDFVLHAPGWAAGLTVLLYGFLLVLAGRAASGRHASLLYFLAAGLALLVFPLPVRSAPHTLRFLTPLYLPVAALVAWAAAPRGASRRAWVAVLGLAVLHLGLGAQLLSTWRRLDRAEAPFLLQDLGPARRALEEAGVRHAYASYGPAFRLTWESGERVVASPPWNDRFRHWPLPLLDEVRFAKNVAWVLTPAIPSGLPPPDELEQTLRRLGGRWRRADAGRAVVFHAFVPPFAPEAVPWPGAGAAGDGDLRTFVEPDPAATFELRLPAPRPLTGVTLLAALDGPRLPRSADVQVSADGLSFETVASRRRREERLDLRWVNGHPQAVIDHDVIAIPLGGRAVLALRVVPVRVGGAVARRRGAAARGAGPAGLGRVAGPRPRLGGAPPRPRRAADARPRGLVLAGAARGAPPPAAVDRELCAAGGSRRPNDAACARRGSQRSGSDDLAPAAGAWSNNGGTIGPWPR